MLPYPSFMPGNKLYRISQLLDRVKKPFYFGNISSYKYHLSLADKYLVEATTLFEYKQYLLASQALRRSDSQFLLVPGFLERARKEGKDVSKLTAEAYEASIVHCRILEGLIRVLPSEFVWKPEKAPVSDLPLESMLQESLKIRKNL